jgi:hypothetical protein
VRSAAPHSEDLPYLENVEATFKPCRSGDLDVIGMPDHRPARDLHPPSTTGSMPTPADASYTQNSQICMGFALIGDKLKLAQNGGSRSLWGRGASPPCGD